MKKQKPPINEILPGDRISIPVLAVEFNNGGNTIWIQSSTGGTTLRIKCSGKIKTDICQSSPISHADINVQGDIEFCISKDAK